MSEEMESLSSILGDTPFSTGEAAKAAPAPPAAELKTEAPVETVETKPEVTSRDEAGRFAPKAEPKPEEKPAITKADVAAIIDERRKRQQLEQEVAALRQQTQKPKTDIFENPDVAIGERLQERLAPLEDTIFQLQVALAKTQMPNFDDAAVAFFQAAQNDPIMKHQADTAPDQLQYIYREGMRLKELGDVGGDITKYREKVLSESKAELAKRDEQITALTAQLEAIQKAQAELAAVPRSLNQLPGASPKGTDADPEDINQIVRFKTG
jgi:hypothetical protein